MGIHILALMTLISCDREQGNQGKEVEVNLSAHITSLSSGTGLWGKTAEIGVFGLETESEKIYSEASNLKYTTTLTTGIFSLAPTDKALKIKDDGTIIDVAAYYPYSASLVSDAEARHICKMDMTDQSSLKPGMLMTARVNELNSVKHSATLALTPVVSQVSISLVIRMTKSASEVPQVFIDGISTTADVDVISGTYKSYGPAATVQLSMADQNIYYYEALLPAQDLTDEAMLRVTYPDSGDGVTQTGLNLKEYVTTLEPNRQYDLEVTVSPEGLRATLVQVSDLNVTNWKEDSEHINGNID